MMIKRKAAENPIMSIKSGGVINLKVSPRYGLMGLMVIYFVILTLLYRFLVAPKFPEYPIINFSILRAIEAYIVFFLAVLLVPIKWKRPSAFFYSMLIIGVFIPMCVIYQFSDYDRVYFYIVTLTIVIMGIAVYMPNLHLPNMVGVTTPVSIFGFLILLVVYGWLLYIGLGHINIDLTKVYVEREYFGNVISGSWGYLISWTGKIIIPTIIGFSMFRKRYFFAGFFMALEFLLFPLTSHKIFAVFAFVPVGIFLIFRFQKHTNVVLVILLFLFAGSVIMLYGADNIWGVALLVQRAIFKPALLNFTYVKVFKDLDPIMLSNSSIVPFIQYPFEFNPPFLVGEFLKGSIKTRSNTGFMGTGYAHFGLIGPACFGVIVVTLLKILDSISKKAPVWLVCVISFGPFSSILIMADLLPSLATHGLLLNLLLVWMVCGGQYIAKTSE